MLDAAFHLFHRPCGSGGEILKDIWLLRDRKQCFTIFHRKTTQDQSFCVQDVRTVFCLHSISSAVRYTFVLQLYCIPFLGIISKGNLPKRPVGSHSFHRYTPSVQWLE